jgi:hypothetical protein
VAKDDSDGGASSRTSRFLPGIHVLRHYRRARLRGDLVAGCTVAAYLIPRVVAYAEVAAAPLQSRSVGCHGAAGGVCSPWVSSRQLSVGPESTTALMTATALAALTASGVLPAEAAAALAIAVGAGCLVGWIARPHDAVLGYVPGLPGMHDIDDYPRGRQLPGRLGESAAGTGEQKYRLCLARLKYELAQILAAAGFLDRIGEDRVYTTLPTAVEAYQQWCRAHPRAKMRRQRGGVTSTPRDERPRSYSRGAFCRRAAEQRVPK